MIAWESAGGAGFKGSRKSTPFAAQVTADAAARKGIEQGLQKVEVFVKGPGSGRETAIRSLQAAGLEVTGVKDVTPQAHNGCRPRKRRAYGVVSEWHRDTSPTVQAVPPRGAEAVPQGRALPDRQVRRRAPLLPAGRARPRPPEAERVPRPAAREAEGQALLRRAREAVPRSTTTRPRASPASPARTCSRMLECRFDNVLVRLGFAASRRQARQLILHGHWTVNGRRVNIPSYQVRDGDVIAITGSSTAHAGDPRRHRADRTGSGVAAGRSRVAHGEGAAQAGAAGDRRAGAGAAHRRAVLEVDASFAVARPPEGGAARADGRRGGGSNPTTLGP